ncbi:hypothetical protein [Thermogemmatispora tikiterensis]|nr:hypothetical protein [Thermogemmatispora tikiterensis]
MSDQVVLFTTDTGMDATLLSHVRPYSARIYRFSYESELGATSVSCEEGGNAPPLPERRKVPGRAY